MALAVLHHLDQPFLGLAEAPLRAAGLELDERHLHAGDPLPAVGEVDGVLSFGGAQSAVDLDAEPVLRDEAALMRDAVAAGVPVLGICLGGQVLAAALGGDVRRARQRTVAWRDLRPLVDDDPLLAAPMPGLHWNEDVFTLPPGAVEVLGPSSEGVEAFRAGERAWGVQFHPEVGDAQLDGWYARYGSWLGEAGVDERAARAADRMYMSAQRDAAQRLFGTFARLVRDA